MLESVRRFEAASFRVNFLAAPARAPRGFANARPAPDRHPANCAAFRRAPSVARALQKERFEERGRMSRHDMKRGARRWAVFLGALLVMTLVGAGSAFAAESDESGVSRTAVEIARPFGFPITNSMVVTWVVALGLIVFSQIATRKMALVPGGAQNLLEWVVGGLDGLLEEIIGPHLVRRTFWFFATIFIFVLATNWFGLIPGVGTVGWGHASAHGFKIDQPLLRGA